MDKEKIRVFVSKYPIQNYLEIIYVEMNTGTVIYGVLGKIHADKNQKNIWLFIDKMGFEEKQIEINGDEVKSMSLFILNKGTRNESLIDKIVSDSQ